jgi:hypothetical protein
VQVNRVEHHPPHVVLLLAVGGVAGPDRARSFIARQVRQLLLLELSLSAYPVHHLQVGVLAGVGEEGEEVVGLLVEAQRVQAPQQERCVPHPGVPVVPVAFPAGCLRQ